MENGRGRNLTSLKMGNRSQILNVLKNTGAISRVDIAKKLHLTPAAITILVNEMLKDGIVVEAGPVEEKDKRSGRKKVLLDINRDYKNIIGINIESDTVNIGVSNIKGEVLVYKRISTDKTLSPKDFLKDIASICMNMLWKENILKENIIGVGVGIVGPVEKTKGVSIHAYGLWKNEVPVKEILEKYLELRVVVDNNVRTLALGEIDYHSKEEMSNVLFLKYGPGIGSSVIINNELYTGSGYSAGEIGHTIVECNGDICRCGRRGCLETTSSYSAIIKEINMIFSIEKTPKLYKLCSEDVANLNLSYVLEAADLGDALVVDILKDAIFKLSVAISNAAKLYDPRRVILYGEAFNNPLIMSNLKAFMSELMVEKDVEDFIFLSKLNYKSNYIGAVALALREFFYNTGGM